MSEMKKADDNPEERDIYERIFAAGQESIRCAGRDCTSSSATARGDGERGQLRCDRGARTQPGGYRSCGTGVGLRDGGEDLYLLAQPGTDTGAGRMVGGKQGRGCARVGLPLPGKARLRGTRPRRRSEVWRGRERTESSAGKRGDRRSSGSTGGDRSSARVVRQRIDQAGLALCESTSRGERVGQLFR